MDAASVQTSKGKPAKSWETTFGEFTARHGDRYKYDPSSYINQKTNMRMQCEEHGWFLRTPIDHSRLGYGCRQCSYKEVGKSKRITWDNFLERANELHEHGYQYIEPKDFTGYQCTIDIICPTHGTFRQKVTHHLSGSGCPECGQLKSGIKNIRKIENGTRGKYTLEEYLKTLPDDYKERFDYHETLYDGKDIKLKILCKEHNEFFWKYPDKHRKSSTGCSQCLRESKRSIIPKSLFFERCFKKHGDTYIYDEDSYKGSHARLGYYCTICNSQVTQLAYSHENLSNGCPNCKSTKGEREIRSFVEEQLDIYPITNDRKTLKNRELDFYFPDRKFAIEFNGTYYHSEIAGKTHPNYHLDKLHRCEEIGINLIQIFEDEWKYKKGICESMIRNRLGKTAKKIYARRCTIKEIQHEDKNNFLHNNHIQGEDQSRIKLGLFANDELVSVMTFAVPRYDKSLEWELSRFCNKLDTNVVGGASKLLSYFIKNYNPKSIISYADRRWSSGGLYETLGFTQVRVSAPRYFYMHKNGYLIREHRSNYTKDRIKKKFPDADLTKTEWELMQEYQYDRIWDCGMLVYTLNL